MKKLTKLLKANKEALFVSILLFSIFSFYHVKYVVYSISDGAFTLLQMNLIVLLFNISIIIIFNTLHIFFRKLLIEYIFVYLAIFISLFIHITYTEIMNIPHDLGYSDVVYLYAIFSFIVAFFVILITRVIYRYIYKISIPNIQLFILIFTITISSFFLPDDNPLILLILYTIGILLYCYYFKYIKNFEKLRRK